MDKHKTQWKEFRYPKVAELFSMETLLQKNTATPKHCYTYTSKVCDWVEAASG